ncbi:MAG: hypothetical protein MJ170_04640 [Alphaproteobacteria bacterium]|nr:hypothetical protein [Alphaproteobacteria bacterium]
MKKILILLGLTALYCGNTVAASRSENVPFRQGTTGQRVTTSTVPVSRSAVNVRSVSDKNVSGGRVTSVNQNKKNTIVRNPQNTNVVSRAAVSRAVSTTISGTQTGAAYEKCKAAYFACMDQFCELKSDEYRRCSCSSRVENLADLRESLLNAGNKLTEFTENLDVVGMTAQQATAMHTASDGENALTADTSASKAILQAIMNSIRGDKATVGGKYSELNSLTLSFDSVNAFGTSDVGQTIAAYNGANLYSAVYPQCRKAVVADCNDASLQRAVTAYLMAIEQDCNTVQTAIEKKQTELKAGLREGSAMLDLARIENRQKHNSDDFTTCLNNVESAILSEEVCGAGYHRCLDNGEYIDVSTGAPIKGVVEFYKLQDLLTFNNEQDITAQQLSKIYSNQPFVTRFESRVKKFAEPALDKCIESADEVWADYLDKAMLDIYYAQQAKVKEIKQGCFDFVSQCYMNGDNAITAAMQELIGKNDVFVQPYSIALQGAMCEDYVASCNKMFDGTIIADYIAQRQNTDTLTACRAIVKQCFDSYGGTNYENFYYPYSGLWNPRDIGDSPMNWFALKDNDGNYISMCAKQLQTIDACKDEKIIEKAFGGFDKCSKGKVDGTEKNKFTCKDEDDGIALYGVSDNGGKYINRGLRSTGVATEVYNQIVDMLTINCANLNGVFRPYQYMNLLEKATYNSNDFCKISEFENGYGVKKDENMCPRGYNDSVEVGWWGACLCWENNHLRSLNGHSAKCVAAIPFEGNCETEGLTVIADVNDWCLEPNTSFACPLKSDKSEIDVYWQNGACKCLDGSSPDIETHECKK